MSPAQLAVVPETMSSASPALPSVTLPDEFWTHSEAFQAVRQHAHAMGVSAFTMLACVLARVSAATHPNIVGPAPVGLPASLNFAVILAAPSGIGKSSATAGSRVLLPVDSHVDRDMVPLGSGEGIAEAYMGVCEDVPHERSQIHQRCLFVADELASQLSSGRRSGSTLWPALRSAITGTDVGQANASAATTRLLQAGRYRFAMVASAQPVVAGQLLEDDHVHAGTPQRFLWADGVDSTIPDHAPLAPASLASWSPPRVPGEQSVMGIATAVAAEIRNAAIDKVRTGVGETEINSHRGLSKSRVAALLGLFCDASELTVTGEMWELAEVVQSASDDVRRNCGTSVTRALKVREREASSRHARRQVEAATSIDSARQSKAFESAARTIKRKVCKSPDDDGKPWSQAALWRAARSTDRSEIDRSELFDFLVATGALTLIVDGYSPGPEGCGS